MPTFDAIQTEIATMLNIPDEELSDEQREVMENYLDELATAEADKVDGFAQFVRIESAHAEAMKEEAKRLAAKAKSRANRIAFLKERYLGIMYSHGLKKVEGNAYTLSIRHNAAVSVPAQIDILPPDYVRTTVTQEADRAAIKDALKAGIEVPGCALVETHSLYIS